MTAILSQDSPAQFRLADATTWADPWPMYRALRDHDPVHHVVPEDRDGAVEPGDYYVLSRHADIWAAARDHQTFSSAQGLMGTDQRVFDGIMVPERKADHRAAGR